MVMERTVTGRPIFPVANGLIFTVSEPVEKLKTKSGKAFYLFHLRTVHNGQSKGYREAVMCFMAAPILRALRCKEVKKGEFEWDRDAVTRAQFMADVIHEPDFKDPSQMRSKLANLRPYPMDEAEGGVEQEPPAATTGEEAEGIGF